MRQQKPARVVGPYMEKGKYRVVVVENGRRQNHFAATEEAALRLRAELQAGLRRAKPKSVEQAISEWLAGKVRSGSCSAISAEQQRVRLKRMLGPAMSDPVGAVTKRQGEAIYARFVDQPSKFTATPPAAATHRKALSIARSFFEWAVGRGYAKKNPLADVVPVGRPRRGKLQLRIDEARAFLAAALAFADSRGDSLAVGAAAALLLGLRASEIVHCRVRDLDDHGRVLWVEGTKTASSRRRLAVPGILQPFLLRLAAKREPLSFLFGESRSGQPRRRAALRLRVRGLCEKASVPIVCPHSLRGLWATLAVESGAVTHAVAAALGHNSFEMTKRHYAQASAIDGAKTAAALGALGLDGEVPRLN